MKINNLKKRKIKDNVFTAVVIITTLISTLPLTLILYYLIKMGVSSISWEFFVNLPSPPGVTGGGISNAIVGTLILIGFSMLFSIPLGVALGVYLSESKKSKFTGLVRISVEILQATPSIVVGIIVYLWVVITMGSFSAFSGAVALAIMMFPLIAKSTEETLKMVPNSIKEASFALGVPYYKTVLKVILPTGMSGVINGILLAVARVAGETAPLLFTAFGNPFMNMDISKPINSLPLLIFNYAGSPYKEWHQLAWGASLILVIMVLLFNITAKGIARKWKIKY